MSMAVIAVPVKVNWMTSESWPSGAMTRAGLPSTRARAVKRARGTAATALLATARAPCRVRGLAAPFVVDFERETQQGTQSPALALIPGQVVVDDPDRGQ